MGQEVKWLDASKIEDVIALGQFDEDIEMRADSTLLILDCQQSKIKNVKSIIFDINKGICLSKYETKKLVNRFVEKNPVTFAFNRALMQFVGNKGVMPYVYGRVMLIPLTGVTQRSTNWFFVNNVSSYTFDSIAGKIILNCEKVFNEPYKIAVKTKPSFCKRVITAAQTLHDLEHEVSLQLIVDHCSDSPQAAAHYTMDVNHAIVAKMLKLREIYHKQFVRCMLQTQEYADPSDDLVDEVYNDVIRKFGRLT
ncbi:hypothetical protein JCM15457_1161 [Liquorilactobacillus sucicola DSM 21376 = JCM 15457]|uniref:Uncharacterized protein n=1 Tax=Liquorilactobacillus sucicola DSM 21376 = JCM 15457 TaxID=1423806 RepID=A0A023CWI7_9LACO|nr:hypothetical protein [Liquorilactobacillus sucicola]KRN06302.1 hypothetical protein FD15_GL001504 [Liquorilactobacillus sucicola DSM 21376 = JCM 15457]GAJ26243.1 hypothetical protein JCM15457_1161 [Liquorilactobacillus sucicola DSM 21376 = JCM 15457]